MAERMKCEGEMVIKPEKTLRDEFAMWAMNQFVYGSVLPEGYDASKDMAQVAQRSYQMADAMMEARNAKA